MDRQGAFRWLRIYPRQTIRATRWQAARIARVQLDTPLPADTVVVIEILPGMRDAHGVTQSRGRMWAIATGDSLPDGELTGSLVLERKPLIDGVVELLPVGPDTVRVEQRPVLRRTLTDSTGTYRLRWLPADGERWLLRTYDDRNRNWRPDDNEAQRLWPDTLSLTADLPRQQLGLRELFSPTTPGQLEGRLAERPAGPGRIFASVAGIAEGDTGYAPVPQQRRAAANQAVPDTGHFTLTGAGPGLVRAIFFVDVDADSLLSAIGASQDTLWYLEPWAVVDSVKVEPGLPTGIPAPVWPDTLTPWPAPVLPDTAIADTLAGGPVDTLDAIDSSLPNTLTTTPADTLEHAPPED
jgi:hypothetical protein